MQKEGIIEYHPQKDKPQISFLMERVRIENLTIDKNRYDFLKKRAEKKTDRYFQLCGRSHLPNPNNF